MRRIKRSLADGPPPHGPERSRGRDDMRLAIAHAAARLIAEGQTDYRAAKQKAARQLNVADRHSLPDNHEIESVLRERLALFAHDSQPKMLSELRQNAIMLMDRLHQFSPWLVGPVLAGTANEFSEIELELVGVGAKEFEMFLLNAGVDFQISEMHRSQGTLTGSAFVYGFEYCGAPVSITRYEHHSARQEAIPRESIKHDRIDLAAARKRFGQPSSKL